MPLFSGKFAYKKSPARRQTPLASLHRELSQNYPHLDYNTNNETIKLELGKQLIHFDTKTGEWIESQPDIKEKKDTQLDKINHLVNNNELLQQENRLLKLKLEILMQMLTEATAELQIQQP